MNIKGPKGPQSAPPNTNAVPASSVKDETGGGPQFAEALQAASATSPDVATHAADIEKVVSQLVEQVSAGKTTASDAREQLVDQVCASMGPMSEDVRERLRSFVADQLSVDPVLSKHASRLFDDEG